MRRPVRFYPSLFTEPASSSAAPSTHHQDDNVVPPVQTNRLISRRDEPAARTIPICASFPAKRDSAFHHPALTIDGNQRIEQPHRDLSGEMVVAGAACRKPGGAVILRGR